MPDWSAIRQDYTNGLSLRALAEKYGVPLTTLHRHKEAEHWNGTSGTPKPTLKTLPDPGTPPALPVRHDIEPSTLPEKKKDDPAQLTVEIAKVLIKKIAQQALGEIDAKDMKLLADTLSQCNKIIATAPAEQEEIAPYDVREMLRWFTDEQLEVIKPMIAEAQQRKNEAEEKVKPMRRTG